ncbi:MAG: hypothetical protein ACT4OV_01380 [Microthrixaceae bacterium]
MNDDELHEALTALGRGDVDPPAPAFADALEQRLVAMHGAVDLRDHRASGSRPAAARSRAMAAVAAAAVLVAGVSYLALRPSTDTQLTLTAAFDTSIVLPDGSIVDAVVGADLPDGALVVTGPRGSARVGSLTVPPNSQAIVGEGSARLVSTSTTGAPGETTTTAAPGVDRTTSSTSPPATTTSQPEDRTTTTVHDAARLELAARRLEDRAVVLRWSMYEGGDFHRYAVLRTLRNTDSGAETTTVVFTTQDRAVLSFRDLLPAGSREAAYRVVALDPADRVVGASPIVRV